MSSDFWNIMTETPSTQRENAIIRAVERCEFDPIEWVNIDVKHNNSTLVLRVAADALKIDSIRINATARTMQKIVDILGCTFPTAKISDIIHANATTTLRACVQSPGNDMGNKSRTFIHSGAVEAQLGETRGLVSTVGKDWVLTNRLLASPGKAANYGWHDRNAPYASADGSKIWQPLGLAHTLDYVDYSQTVRLVSRDCLLNGKSTDLFDVLRGSDEIVNAISYEGPLQLTRLPGTSPHERSKLPKQPGTLGDRCVQWCLKHVGKISETQLQKWWSSTGALGVPPGAAFQCAATFACQSVTDPTMHGFRATAIELVNDAAGDSFDSVYVPDRLVKSKKFIPSVGDLVVIKTYKDYKERNWLFSVVKRVQSYDLAEGTVSAIGFESRDRITEHTLSVDNSRIVGWIHYPKQKTEKHKLTAKEKKEIYQALATTREFMTRSKFGNDI